MPKIVFTPRYVRDAPPAQLENYVRYIGAHEGAERVDESKLLLPAIINQRSLIRQLIHNVPAAKETLEYTDFLLQPTIGNASELISCALEQHLGLIGKRENYVDYIANRPRVERVSEHGFFTDAEQSVVLAKVQGEVAEHKGAVRTYVVSLWREDAARLGCDSAKQQMALLRSRRAVLCRHMRVDSKSLRWYAAFHNGGHHPHVHLVVCSAKDNGGYLVEKSIEAMRSELAHDIFRQDFAHLYDRQSRARTELKTGTAGVMRKTMKELRPDTLINPEIQGQMVKSSERLQSAGGKKVYGYLKWDVKNLIDRAVDELAEDNRVDALYQARGKWQNEILLTYQSTAPSLPLLSRQPQLKSIRNMIATEAMSLGRHQVTFGDETTSFIKSDDLPESEDGQELSEEAIPE